MPMDYILKYFFDSSFRKKIMRVINRRGIALLLSLLLGFQ